MTDYTVEDVKRAVEGFNDDGWSDALDQWKEFYYTLRNEESVRLWPLFFAQLEDEQGPERDSYGDPYGDTHFVFRVYGPDRVVRYFKKNGAANSYSGAEWRGSLEEVAAAPKVRTEWKVI